MAANAQRLADHFTGTVASVLQSSSIIHLLAVAIVSGQFLS
jgi:hypothetical protein